MRRKDREMSKDFGLMVIDKAQYGVLNLPEGASAYGVPLSIARVDETLYFHSAKEGKKCDLIVDGQRVHVVFVGDVQVPSVLDPDQVDVNVETLTTGEFGKIFNKTFTTEFESAMVLGEIRKVTEDAEKTKGLRAISEKFTPQWMSYFDYAVASGLKITAVYAIDILEVTAKRKKYDASGHEMKWGREV